MLHIDYHTTERRRWLAELQDNMRRNRAWLFARAGSGRMRTCRRTDTGALL